MWAFDYFRSIPFISSSIFHFRSEIVVVMESAGYFFHTWCKEKTLSQYASTEYLVWENLIYGQNSEYM